MVGRLAHAVLALTLGIVSVEGTALAQDADGDPLLRLQFAPGASRLQPGAAGSEGLVRVRAFLASHPDVTKLRIEAHANNVGTPQSAQALTVERALGVKNALIALGPMADASLRWRSARTVPSRTTLRLPVAR